MPKSRFECQARSVGKAVTNRHTSQVTYRSTFSSRLTRHGRAISRKLISPIIATGTIAVSTAFVSFPKTR